MLHVQGWNLPVAFDLAPDAAERVPSTPPEWIGLLDALGSALRRAPVRPAVKVQLGDAEAGGGQVSLAVTLEYRLPVRHDSAHAAGQGVIDLAVLAPLGGWANAGPRPGSAEEQVGLLDRVAAYLDTSPDTLQALRSAVEDIDMPAVVRLSDALAAASQQVGASGLVTRLERLRDAAARQAAEEAVHRWCEAEMAWEDVCGALKALLGLRLDGNPVAGIATV